MGLIVKTRAKSIIQNYLDRLFSRVPLIRSIYSPVSRVVRLATNRTGAPGDLSGMSVVSCRFFGSSETAVDILALLASQQLYLISQANGAGLSIFRPLRYPCLAALYSSPTRLSRPSPT